MSALNQADMSSTWPRASGVKPAVPRSIVAGRTGEISILKTFFLVVGCGLLFGLGLAYVAWHYAGQDAAAPAAQPRTLPTARPTPPARQPAPGASFVPPAQPPGPSARYRVKVETAYFFDVPQQSTPNGRYLRRGDVFYGQGETNGFVKTGFVQPNGSAGTGWLKLDGLTKLGGSAPRPAAASRAAAPAAVPAAAPTPAKPARPVAAAAEPSGSAGAQTAVVQVAKSYFYDSSDLAQPRKAHCVRGDKVRLGESQGEAVYVTFTNWEKVTTSGWMRQDALR
ncbi:MAG TPA: hypothetical protein VF629_11040 [Hymenobacter sp.]|jgi:hypothetical protein|uniref:hypothetical protein n=1 Tax=Hymenobacter sp. TaxID=1898978 RepID=UPI002ED8FA93